MIELKMQQHRFDNRCLVCGTDTPADWIRSQATGSWYYASFHGMPLFAGPFCSVPCVGTFRAWRRSDQYRAIFGSSALGRYLTALARRVSRTGDHVYTFEVTDTTQEPCPHVSCKHRKPGKGGISICDDSVLNTLELTERDWPPETGYEVGR
jgi:hypothetical protein